MAKYSLDGFAQRMGWSKEYARQHCRGDVIRGKRLTLPSPWTAEKIGRDWMLEREQGDSTPTLQVKGLGAIVYSIELRDLFAMMLAHHAYFGCGASPDTSPDALVIREACEHVYELADALLIAREKKE